MKNLAHYSIDISFLPPEERTKIFNQLNGSCWTAGTTDVPEVYDVYWETDRGSISSLPYLPQNCIIKKLP